jgi:hypothetical protein
MRYFGVLEPQDHVEFIKADDAFIEHGTLMFYDYSPITKIIKGYSASRWLTFSELTEDQYNKNDIYHIYHVRDSE